MVDDAVIEIDDDELDVDDKLNDDKVDEDEEIVVEDEKLVDEDVDGTVDDDDANDGGDKDEDDEDDLDDDEDPPDDEPDPPDPPASLSNTTTLAFWPLGTVTTQKVAPPAPAVSLPEHSLTECLAGSMAHGRPLHPSPSHSILTPHLGMSSRKGVAGSR